jgi:hypothetical protein
MVRPPLPACLHAADHAAPPTTQIQVQIALGLHPARCGVFPPAPAPHFVPFQASPFILHVHAYARDMQLHGMHRLDYTGFENYGMHMGA